MEAAEGEGEVLNQRVADLTTSLNNILGSLQDMEKWIPSVDAGIKELHHSVEGLATRVTVLESKPPAAAPTETTTPQLKEQRVADAHQGAAPGPFIGRERTLVGGKVPHPITPIAFDFGESSERGGGNSAFSVRSNSPCLPKTDFPDLMEITQNCGGKILKNILKCIKCHSTHGHLLPPSTSRKMLHCGYKPMKLCTL